MDAVDAVDAVDDVDDVDDCTSCRLCCARSPHRDYSGFWKRDLLGTRKQIRGRRHNLKDSRVNMWRHVESKLRP